MNGLAFAGGALSALAILFSLCLVTYAVFQRYVLGTPLPWGDELIGYMVVGIVMFGAAEALRRGDHISIDLLSDHAGPRTSRLLAVWSSLAVLAFAVIVGLSAWESITFNYDFGAYSVGYLEVAMWIPQLPMLAGAWLLGLVALVRALESLLGRAPA